MMHNCICGEIMIGMKKSGHYNLNLDCPIHGLNSDWYNAPDQISKRKDDSKRLIELQALARDRRAN